MHGAKPLALVTGASNGIGRELAALLAERGFDLVATGRSANINTAAEQFTAAGAQVEAVQADLSAPDDVEKVWRAVRDTGRPLEVAAINAGVSLGGAFLDNDLEQERALLELNVTSVVHLTKRVATAMTEQGRGRILITSSISATLPTPYETVYGPSRAFTRMFALGLREELRGTGVSVTAFLPGATDSDFHARAGMNNTAFGPSAQKNDKSEVARQGYVALMAGDAEVVAGDRATKRTGLLNRFLPETFKAARHARKAKPRD